jgi:hypothetical protein
VSGSDYLSEAATRERVHSFCQALTGKNLDKLRILLSDEASLSWGPYDFEGKESIITWAGELFELFPFMTFKEKNQARVLDSIHDVAGAERLAPMREHLRIQRRQDQSGESESTPWFPGGQQRRYREG